MPDKYSRLALSFKTKVPLENILKLSIQDCSNFLKLITTDCATSPSSSKYSLFPSEKILLAIPAVISKNINTKGAVLALLRDLYTAYSSRSYATTEQKKAIDDVILKVENTINFLVNPTIFLTEELINEATMDLNNPVHQALSEIANAIRDDQISNEAKRDEILEFISTSSAHKGPRCIKIK